jgi:hypothetical protein
VFRRSIGDSRNRNIHHHTLLIQASSLRDPEHCVNPLNIDHNPDDKTIFFGAALGLPVPEFGEWLSIFTSFCIMGSREVGTFSLCPSAAHQLLAPHSLAFAA